VLAGPTVNGVDRGNLAFVAQGEDSLQVLWQDGERVFCRGSRLGVDGSRGSVLVVLPAAEHPLPSSLERLAHEYALKDELDGAWAVRPLELGRDRDRTMLVLEDPDGEPLERLLGSPMEIGRFLRLAISIVAALGKAHQRGLVHKDIKPANILVKHASGEVRFTGFGIASRLSRERQAPGPPEVIAGTLAYMAPEQTGHMNRSMDSRSDLYALGVTLYEMLTGSLPFTASDPMEWVHCHIARRPTPPTERVTTIPPVVSAIIMKLLAKTAEERYQTAAGLERDLQRCLAEWDSRGRIDAFALGAHDMPDRLVIPEKLYGREREIETLRSAFERVASGGTPELLLVCGYSGIGKSSVVHELHKALGPSGLFASGKFDQYRRDTPYATLAQAFRSLVRGLLAKSETDLEPWRDAFREALGPNAQLVVDLVPELKLIIGEQPPVAELSPQDAGRRFQMVFRGFIGVFAKPEHPLALFLDDLQWLDAATLDLLEGLLTQPDVRHILVIGAYRDNEVDPTHPLKRRLDTIRQAGAPVQEIALWPLAPEDLTRLLADALHCEQQEAKPLAQLVHNKTDGNPFFAIQFLSELAGEGLLTIDRAKQRWSWDLQRIHAKGYTANVIDLMVTKLHRLPVETQEALQQLACLGNRADIATLSIIRGTSAAEVHANLWEALRQEFLVRLDSSYKFVHDRIQEATYSLIREERRAEAHLRIGRLLRARTPPENGNGAIFEIVGQLNRAAALITTAEEREQLAELNLIAGKRAKASSAYASALTYFTTGAALLPDDGWNRLHELAFALELNRAESEYLTGNLPAAEECLEMLSHRVLSRAELAALTCVRVNLFTTLDRTDHAVEAGLHYLHSVGVPWSIHPTMEDVQQEFERIWAQLGSRSIPELIDLPLMKDPELHATMNVLAALLPPALFTDRNLFRLIVAHMANVSLQHGNSDGSCLAYVWLGLLLGPDFDNYPAAFEFGQLGLDLVEKRGLDRFRARVYLDFSHVVNPWMKHARFGPAWVRRALDAASEVGDLTFAGYCGCNLISALLATGDPLADVQREAERQRESALKARFGLIVDIITGQLRFILALRGLTPRLSSFDGEGFDERDFERHLDEDPGMAVAIGWYWVRKLQARFFAGDLPAATEAATKVGPFLWTIPSHLEIAEYHFFAALAGSASHDTLPIQNRPRLLAELRDHHKQLETWAQHCPENFEHSASLVGAEIARIEGRSLHAMKLYERAIKSASASGFVHSEALANELAARFYAAHGFEKIARVYWQDARRGYLRWGADGKVRQLDQLYPHFRQDGPVPGPTSTIGAPIDHLDLATVIKVSQAVSGEIVLEKLLDTLMRTALEQAGAERGLLIFLRGTEPRIAAEATTGHTIVVHQRDDPATATALPESILRYVLHTSESVILDDAAAQSQFVADPYICQRRARSVLCLPLLNQAKLIGVLYLENNLAPGVFAPARTAVLKLLASQAAIALQNTQLYRDLEQRQAKIRRMVDANIIGIFIWDFEGRILEANDAFLRIVGYDRDDLASNRLRWTALTPSKWSDRTVQVVAELNRTGFAQPYEKEFFRKDGSCVPVLIGVAVFEEGGSEGVAFVLDLTERKRSEAALRESEEQWKAVFENNPTMFFMVDASGTVISVNPFGAEQLGYGVDELIGRPVQILFHEADRESALRNKASCLEHPGRTKTWELRKLRKDGGVLWVRETGRAMLLKDRPVVLVVSEDITEAKRAAETLREVQTELAHANRVAALGQLTASIAHEVNQPLGAMVNNANAALRFLDRQPLDLEEVREALASIVENGYRAGDVVSRIRAFVKKTPPRLESFDMNEAIREVIVVTRGEAATNGIAVEARLAEGLPPVHGDRVQLQQVMLNLIINAIEAMSDVGEGTRELRIETAKSGSDSVAVAVQDSGPGLGSENLSRAFEAFYTTKPQGLGIGLSICRSIVEAHGGTLGVAANVPHGATFEFTVPTRPDGS